MSDTITPRPRTLAIHVAAVAAVLLGAFALLAGPARADGGGTSPFIQWHAAFSAGQTTNLTAGTVMVMRYVDPSSQTSVKQFCWSPAPIDQAPCSPFGTGAPAQAGTQTVTAYLTNGQQVQTTFQVGPQATQIGSGTGWSPPVLGTSSCAITLSGDAALDTALGNVTVGQQLGAYSTPRPNVTQVYDYSTNQSGFIPSACMQLPPSNTLNVVRTVKLRSNRTQTYRMSVPMMFHPTVTPGSTGIAYALYRGTAVGSGVGNSIKASGGRHQPYLGATVLKSSFQNDVVSVTVKTGRVNNLTLRLSAVGPAL